MPAQFFLAIWLLLGGLAGSAAGQSTTLPAPSRRITYYDAARTRPRMVVGIYLRGTRPDTVLDGPYRRYWPGGGLAEVGHFSTGLADSVWTRYYPAAPGQVPALARRLPMRAGYPDGPFLVLHPNGQLAQRGTYRRGQLLDSLTTRTATGQPRLLAYFVADSAGPAGRFVQWRSEVTAQPLGPAGPRGDFSFDNPYPVADTGRYWVGRLTGGRFTGALSEHDADGQLRVRLLYAPAGRVQLVTLYYPAAWRGHELRHDYLLDSGQVVRSQPRWQAQWLGRNLLYQYFDWTNESGRPQSQVIIRPVLVPHLAPPTTCLIAPLPPVARPPGQPRPRSAAEAFSPSERYQAPPAAPSKYGAAADKYYQQATGRQLLAGPTRHLLGQTDTLTGIFRREHRRESISAAGRVVETATIRRDYRPDGSLESTTRKARRYTVTRGYEHGRRVECRKGYDDRRRYLRRWDEHGRLLYDSRTTRDGTTYARRRDGKGHLPFRRTKTHPMRP